MQVVDNRALVLDAPPKKVLANIASAAKLSGGKVAVKWELNEASQLAALGVDNVPSPIFRDYKWPGKFPPYSHQKITASFLTLHERAFCFSEQGTGKTASAIWAADYLLSVGAVRRVLVVCPLSIMKAAWQADLFQCAMHRSVAIAHGTPKQRVKILDQGTQFVIINFDGIETVESEISESGFDLIIVDEATAYKNPKTTRWQVLNRILGRTKPRLWMLTGTPAAQSPMDAFGLAKLVNPHNVPRFMGAFRDSVMYKVTQFKWAARPNAEQTVHRVLQPAIRFERKECIDLPDVTYNEREAPLTTMQRKYYAALKHRLAVEAAGQNISAVNAATMINKLLQISGGAVYGDQGDIVEFDVSSRLSVVLEAVRETPHKALIFVPYTHTIDLVSAYLAKHHISSEVINGKVPASVRGDIVKRFQTNTDPHVLIIQPQAAAHGLTLTAADTVIWYSPVTSVEIYLQANARIIRPGQKNRMNIVHIWGSDVEAKMYYLLRNNIAVHEKVIDLYNGDA